jgi:hypothetical protein
VYETTSFWPKRAISIKKMEILNFKISPQFLICSIRP